MRSSDSPLASPSLDSTHPVVFHQGSYLHNNNIPEASTSSSAAAAAFLDPPTHLLPVTHLGAYFWHESTSTPDSQLTSAPAYAPPPPAQSHDQQHSRTEPHEDAEITQDDDDLVMLDVEEGDAPLVDLDMDDPSDHGQDPPPEAEPVQDTIEVQVIPPDSPSPPPSPPAQPQFAAQIPDQNLLNPNNAAQPGAPNANGNANAMGAHHDILSNANPDALGPENPNLLDFLQLWQWRGRDDVRPVPQNLGTLRTDPTPRVQRKDLNGDAYDLQGINWRYLGVDRKLARRYRRMTFENYTNRPRSDRWSNSCPDMSLPRVENYFRFQSMDVRRDVSLLHFQLRNILGCASRTQVFYPSRTHRGVVRELDPTTGRCQKAMGFDTERDAAVSTLTAGENILIAGSFYGTYRYRSLQSDYQNCADGRLTNHHSGITNHVQIQTPRRSGVPQAAFASNDAGFRVLDLTTNKITSRTVFGYSLNCSALSPDKTLRVMVGDHRNVLIVDAESGQILQQLDGHRDFGFACDWAPDGWKVATGNQDKSIRIWDARKWKDSLGRSQCLETIRTEMAGPRNLRFSPLGSGKRVLVAAEEADFINVIDAETFETQQTVDIFGELSGLAFTNHGQELIALSSDRDRGGIMRFERCDAGAEDHYDYGYTCYPKYAWQTAGYDWTWTPEQAVTASGSQTTLTQKRRQAAMSEDWLF
ncbi:hypothetical protein F4780DRAFT_442261 [Xylariomycetidae sp. FL0641]|nr:hypothetical protein F4780DRAFT_442261 [Xylariomycetidae sp. FL0641]